MGTLFVDKLDPQSGTSLEIGSSGDTMTVPSGATLDIASGATLDATGATVTGISGGLVFINQASTSSSVSNLTLDNVFTTTYKNYLLIGEYTPATNNVEARFLFRTGGSSGSDLTASEYAYSFVLGKADVSTYNSTQATGAASCGFAPDVNNDTARVGVRLAWTVFDPFSTNRTTLSGTGKYTQSDANFGSILGGCDYKGSTSITGIKFYFNSGNVAAGHFRVYGIVDS